MRCFFSSLAICKTAGGMHPLARFETSGSGVGDSLMQGASMMEVRCLEKRERHGDTKKRCQARRAASSGGTAMTSPSHPHPTSLDTSAQICLLTSLSNTIQTDSWRARASRETTVLGQLSASAS